jgi:hypothetical protein
VLKPAKEEKEIRYHRLRFQSKGLTGPSDEIDSILSRTVKRHSQLASFAKDFRILALQRKVKHRSQILMSIVGGRRRLTLGGYEKVRKLAGGHFRPAENAPENTFVLLHF